MSVFGLDPAIEILLFSIMISIVSALLNKKLVNQDRMTEIKKKIKDFQTRYNEAKKSGDQNLIKKLEEEQKEVLGLTKEMMSNSFKPLLYTFLPFMILLYFLSSAYGSLGNIMTLPIFNWELNWLWWYILVSVATAIVFELIYKTYKKSKTTQQTIQQQ